MNQLQRQKYQEAEYHIAKAFKYINEWNDRQNQLSEQQQQRQDQRELQHHQQDEHHHHQKQQQQQQNMPECSEEKAWSVCCQILKYFSRPIDSTPNQQVRDISQEFIAYIVKKYNILNVIDQSLSKSNDLDEDPSPWLLCSLYLLVSNQSLSLLNSTTTTLSQKLVQQTNILNELLTVLNETDDGQLRTRVIAIFSNVIYACTKVENNDNLLLSFVPITILERTLQIYWSDEMMPHVINIIQCYHSFLCVNEEYRQTAVDRLYEERTSTLAMTTNHNYRKSDGIIQQGDTTNDDDNDDNNNDNDKQIKELLYSLIGEAPCFLRNDGMMQNFLEPSALQSTRTIHIISSEC